jgi:hypothetical protein
MALSKPASYSSLLYDPSRITKNIAGQWAYGDQKEFLDPRLVEVFGYQRTLTSGYSVYVSEIGKQRNSSYLTTLKNDLAYLGVNLFHKTGGFVNKNKLQIIIDAIDPNSTSPGALLPQESYNLILNVSNPIKTIGISGAIVQKANGKFVIKGYDKYKPYFTIFTSKRNSTTPAITVGGVSESFVDWTASETGGNSGLSDVDTTTASGAATGSFYRQGQIVRYSQRYYRTTVSHRAGTTFNTAYFQSLNSLPIVGGVSVQIATGFNLDPVRIPYGTEFDKIQDLYDMLVGYGKWLESQGFIFDEYNKDLNELVDWKLSAKEFLYWTTQNWAENSIITLSPFANRIKYTLLNSVVDNIFDSFYEYDVNVPAAEYDIVYSYFRKEMTTANAAGNFTVSLFRVAEETGIPALDLLQQFSGQNGVNLNVQLAYFLNSIRNNATLLGVGVPVQSNRYAARLIVQ